MRMEGEIQQAEEDMDRYDSLIDRATVEAEKAAQERKVLEDERAVLQQAIDEERDSLSSKEDAFNEMSVKLQKIEKRKKKAEGKRKELVGKLKKFEAELLHHKKEVEKAELGAREFCGIDEEIDSLFDSKLLLSKITAVKQRIKKAEERRGGRALEDIEDDLYAAEKKFMEAKRSIERVSDTSDRLQKGIKMRSKSCTSPLVQCFLAPSASHSDRLSRVVLCRAHHSLQTRGSGKVRQTKPGSTSTTTSRRRATQAT